MIGFPPKSETDDWRYFLFHVAREAGVRVREVPTTPIRTERGPAEEKDGL